jgi:subfamily B ATP-binding cassette protein MsbA
MYLSFTALMAMPVVQLANIGTQLSEALAGLDRIREIRRMATEDQEDAGLAPLDDVRGEIEFDAVTFEYNPGVPVLKQVTFRAPAGSTTALVGSSGSGKSTLISLVMAFNRPLSGRVLVDGRDLATVPSCRTTSCSTAQLPKISPTPGRTPRAMTSRGRV